MVAVRADHPLATQINPPSLLECAEHPLVITTAAGASSYYEDVFARTRAAGVPLRIASEAAGWPHCWGWWRRALVPPCCRAR